MKNVAILQRSDNKISAVSVHPLLDKLFSLGCDIYVPLSHCGFYSSFAHRLHFFSNDFDRSIFDVIFVLGGDGSILSAARENAVFGVPIVGVNFGNLAYMAEIEISDLDFVDSLHNGSYFVDERIMLDVSVIRQGKTISMKYPSLNDVVLSNGPIPKLVSFELHADGVLAQSYLSDGMVIATPTGSTAYSLSAGGPVLDPKLECIVATPICPHSIGQRPVVFGSESVLEIKNFSCRNDNIYISSDGREVISLEEDDVIRITRSEFVTKLIRSKDSSFLKILHEKMGGPRMQVIK